MATGQPGAVGPRLDGDCRSGPFSRTTSATSAPARGARMTLGRSEAPFPYVLSGREAMVQPSLQPDTRPARSRHGRQYGDTQPVPIRQRVPGERHEPGKRDSDHDHGGAPCADGTDSADGADADSVSPVSPAAGPADPHRQPMPGHDEERQAGRDRRTLRRAPRELSHSASPASPVSVPGTS